MQSGSASALFHSHLLLTSGSAFLLNTLLLRINGAGFFHAPLVRCQPRQAKKHRLVTIRRGRLPCLTDSRLQELLRPVSGDPQPPL
ncbi:hypothetical protein ONE63_003420 [Megalurothrips usitatus]|uniref:Secreted protein n=1 Tax=Megalurothrips usitatus TaxID=439358 RepID=A0AAV7X782_9NEOP|nr:hypothetical protein ONE63_003420 [Megalurothrips usitatus]